MTRQLPATANRVLVDTSAHFALADPHDHNHQPAIPIVQRLIAARSQLFTTNFVLAETHALLLLRRGRAAARRTLQQINQGTITFDRHFAQYGLTVLAP